MSAIIDFGIALLNAGRGVIAIWNFLTEYVF